VLAAVVLAGTVEGVALDIGPAAAQTDSDAAERAAREIQAARDRANAAAEAYFQKQSDLEVLEDEAAALEVEVDQLQVAVDRLRGDVESLAISRFVNSGSSGIPLLTGVEEPQDQIQADVLVDVLTNTGADVLDQYDAVATELAEKQDQLAQQKADIEQEQVVLEQLQADAEAEVVLLREIEEERLKDEAVRLALEAQQAEERARQEAAVRRLAEAAAAAAPNPGLLPQDGSGDAAGTGDAGAGPTLTVPNNGGPSGGTSGGRTGTPGAGSFPGGIDTGSGYVDNIVCPMTGSAYGDTWGAPRSGGRRHEGVDMLAPIGVPIVAVTNGVVSFRQNRLGGLAVSLAGDNGNRYYYAHLSAYEGSSRRVTAGEVIGYNGDTGNARGTPHLHFEVHPGGGIAVNPTPSVRAAGC
jgi:murein DD-endopeptidase MepM/ murein hydrolase activator NlpD